MRNSSTLRGASGLGAGRLQLPSVGAPRQLLLGLILIFALVAFEAFNFDTTRYALQNLLGDVRFAGFAWATILAVAFCAIDFAGLSRLFTPERGLGEPKEIWYLTGAWLLGATMNAVMTWWAVSSVLLSHELGNEVLSREQLLHIVPVFVAILVWLTRILFIGALTLAGERLLHGEGTAQGAQSKHTPAAQPVRGSEAPAFASGQRSASTMQAKPASASSAPPPAPSGSSGNTVPGGRRPPRPQTGNSNAYRSLRADSRYRR